MSLIPRDYQIRAVAKSREELRKGRRAVLLVSPTGSGKTFIACMIIKRAVAKNGRVLFLAHREELIRQASDKLTEFGVTHGIIKAGYPETLRRPVQVASVQTFRARADRLPQGFDLIIHDEAHRAVSNEHQIPRRLNPKAIALGLTATPCRLDGRGLMQAFDSMVKVASVQELVDLGHLAPTRVFTGPKIQGLNALHKQAGDYKQDELEEIVNNQGMVSEVVREWHRLAYGRSTVVFGSSVAHSKVICAAFLEKGISAVHVDGQMERTKENDERRAAFSGFQSGKYTVICNYGICTEGWDAPFCSCGIGARPTLSLALYLQMVGRIMRIDEGKTDALWLDFGNLTATHGYVTDPHRWTLDGLDKTAEENIVTQYKCKVCGLVLKSNPRWCPGCGTDTKAKENELFESVSDSGYILIEVKGRGPALSSRKVNPMLLRYLSDLKTAYLRGYKPGWADHRYKARTGGNPTDEMRDRSRYKTEVEIDAETGRTRRVWQVAP